MALNYGFTIGLSKHTQLSDLGDLMVPEKLHLCIINLIKDGSIVIIMIKCNNLKLKVIKIKEDYLNNLLKNQIGYEALYIFINALERKFISKFKYDERFYKLKSTFGLSNNITSIKGIDENTIYKPYKSRINSSCFKSMIYTILKMFYTTNNNKVIKRFSTVLFRFTNLKDIKSNLI